MEGIRPIFVVSTNGNTSPTKVIEKLGYNGEIQDVGGNCWTHVWYDFFIFYKFFLIFRSTIDGLQISADLLLNHFGACKFVTKFVARNLINKLLNLIEFLDILKELKQPNLSSTMNKATDNKVFFILAIKFLDL